MKSIKEIKHGLKIIILIMTIFLFLNTVFYLITTNLENLIVSIVLFIILIINLKSYFTINKLSKSKI